MEKAKIISIANQKGGVGKTTTTYNLAYELSCLGKKVLCIDLDMQSNLTNALGIKNNEKISIGDLLDRIISNQDIGKDLDYLYTVNGVDAIGSNINLSIVDNKLKIEMGAEQILNILLDELNLRSKYDYILLDLSPSLNSLTINALVCSDEVLIPMNLEKFALLGFEGFMSSIVSVKRRMNRKLNISGIVLTMVDERLTLNKEIKNALKDKVKDKIRIFNSEIPKTTEIGKSLNEHLPISVFNNKSKASVEYKNLAEEILRG